ncbi:MAG: MCE family protein [Planctomycetes bacterium]|nr:MCE family protein [Planctomycetota bacterium]
MHRAYWVGFFFFVAMVLLLFGSLTLANVSFTEPFKLRLHFDRVAGLRKGNDVRVDGLLVGHVAHVKLDGRGGVKVTCHLEEPVELYEGCTIYVETFTLLGGNFISITRGNIGGKKVDTSHYLIGKARPSALEEAGEVLSENRDNFRNMLDSIQNAANEIKSLVSEIREGQGTAGRLVKDTALYDEAVAAARDVREIADKLNRGVGTAGKLINDPSLHDELKASVADFKAAAAEAREALQKINSGEGTVGKLIYDPDMAEDFKKTAENLRKLTENLDQVTGKLTRGEGTLGRLIQEEKLHQDAERTLQSFDETLGRAARARVMLGGEARSFAESDVLISRVYVRLWPDETKYFQLGAAFLSLDASGPLLFEEKLESGDNDLLIKVDAQVLYKEPWFFDNHVGLRAGLIEGKPGGGVDIAFAPGDIPMLLSFEMRDAYNDAEDEDLDEQVRGPMMRLFFQSALWSPGGRAWYEQILHALRVTLGASRLQDDPEYFLGVGFEFEDRDLRSLVGLAATAR